MTALDLADGFPGGIAAWYSTVHTPPELLPKVFAEFHRVLTAGGHPLPAFKTGDEHRRLDRDRSSLRAHLRTEPDPCLRRVGT